MGCDIHLVVEQRKANSGEWIGLWSSDRIPAGRPLVARRDYDFFTEVAGVRGRSDTTLWPRNIPEDVSRLAWSQYMQAPTDHHTPSHASPDEFVAAWLRANRESDKVRPEFAVYDLLGIAADYPEGAAYRVVFWFDN